MVGLAAGIQKWFDGVAIELTDHRLTSGFQTDETHFIFSGERKEMND
jgi:hypothetical protein